MSGNYFGDPGNGGSVGGAVNELLPIINHLKDRALQDYHTKGMIDQDLAVRQANMRNIFDPAKTSQVPGTGMNVNPNMNTVLKEDISPLDKAKLGQGQQGIELDKQKLSQQGKFGQEALDIKDKQEQLNSTKNQNIHDQKIQDMQRKVEDSTNKLGLSYDRLQQNADNANAHIQFNRDQMAATEARHALELAQRDKAQNDMANLHAAQIKNMQDKLDQATKPTTKTTTVNPEGTSKTETTQKGNVINNTNTNSTIKMTGKDGQSYMIPSTKKDQAIKDGFIESTQDQ